mmetsp:Transcript_10079/g.12458  ORF Transcript_10079/g.12458 Transcript_10079/m.12458 type:complete len:98 (+) Transcript_10079:536-829(+)
MILAPSIAERRNPFPKEESVIAAMPSSVTALEMEGAVVAMAKVFKNMLWSDALRLTAKCAVFFPCLTLLLEDRALHVYVGDCKVHIALMMRALRIHL